MARVLLSAFGIHAGGGRVLLEALLRELRGALKAAVLDTRLRERVAALDLPAEFVAPSLRQRVRGLHALARQAAPGDVLFCFNGLPPLRPAGGARVIVYVQTRHLLVRHREAGEPLRGVLRVALERRWLRLGLRNCHEMWVQTPAMAELARSVFPGLEVRVLPFVDDDLAQRLRDAGTAARRDVPAPSAASFFYPADGVPHKNHGALVRAWHALAGRGCRPVLYLTLPAADHERVLRELPPAATPPRIVNLGPLAREQVLQRLAASSALIFPSTLESFGLPLLEARALGVPVLASERDFVRDVCEPQQTFDPASPESIADAVQRFLAPRAAQDERAVGAGAAARPGLSVLSAADFARVLAS